jgi:predicted  nucleic acid-binding Zn-ribbon protein
MNAQHDTICKCGHWYEEHDPGDAECCAPECTCSTFAYSAEESTPEAIANRGGDPELWPQRVKDALGAQA